MPEIFAFDYLSSSNDLQHHGIKGQKWGVRRFQNPDGTLTPLGKKRYGSVENFNRKLAEANKNRLARQKQLADKKQESINKKKQALIRKGDLDKIYKNRNLFSDEELQAIINRERLANQIKTRKQREIEERAYNVANAARYAVGNVKQITDTAKDLMTIYDTVSSGVNFIKGKDVLPNKKTMENKLKNKLNNMTYDDVIKNQKDLSNEQLKYLSDRAASINKYGINTESYTKREREYAEKAIKESLDVILKDHI